jgi:hypothetical protein
MHALAVEELYKKRADGKEEEEGKIHTKGVSKDDVARKRERETDQNYTTQPRQRGKKRRKGITESLSHFCFDDSSTLSTNNSLTLVAFAWHDRTKIRRIPFSFYNRHRTRWVGYTMIHIFLPCDK